MKSLRNKHHTALPGQKVSGLKAGDLVCPPVTNQRTSMVDTQKRLARAIDGLENSLDINLAPSRFTRYNNLLIEVINAIRDDGVWNGTQSKMKLLAQAKYESKILSDAYDVAIQRNQLRDLRYIFSRLLKAEDLPEHDFPKSQGRNFLLELDAYRLLSCGGLNVSIKEPDLATDVAGWRLSFAVKRVRSRSKVVARIKEGEKQIWRSRSSGVVWLDVSKIINPQNMWCGSKDGSRPSFRHLAQILDQIAEDYEPEIRKNCRCVEMVGIVYHGYHLVSSDDLMNGGSLACSLLHMLNEADAPGRLERLRHVSDCMNFAYNRN
ncbi:MAG: hypothetical protein AAGJ38_00795 [Planctomycetota bacterium]